MSVRFIIGRAGTGKTQYCLAAVRERLLARPLEGPRLILLVPEQASLQTERALLACPELSVAHRAEVLSFRRLALRIGGPPGSEDRTVLSPNGRAMVLRHLLSKLGPNLVYFKSAERFPGFIERLGRTIDELIHEAVAAEDFGRALETPVDDLFSEHKIRDLQRIFAAYLEYLGDARWDPSQRLEAARARIGACPWLHGAEVWVDGFAGFTRQERLTLVALAQIAARLEITLLLDPQYAGIERLTALPPADLFAKPARAYVDLKRTFRENGVPVETPILLTPATPPRFAAALPLAAIERGLFQETPPPDLTRFPHETTKTQRQRDSSFPSVPLCLCGEISERTAAVQPAVRVIEVSNRRVEVDWVAAAIAHLVQSADGSLRYRNIGITVRDLEPYHDLLAASLEARGIPYFIDRRRPTRHHPLVEWLRGFVQLPLEPLAPDTVRLLLKTGLSGLGSDECDLVENHLIATELSGLEAWSRPWKAGLGRWNEDDTPARRQAGAERLARLNRARQALLERFLPWVTSAVGRETRTSREWAEALSAHLDRLGVTEKVAAWAGSAEESGDLDRAEEHRQILCDLAEVLDELGALLPEEPLTLRGLAQMLDSAWAQFTLGLTPPTLDQVLVTGIERSRNPDLAVLFVAGFNDGLFPRTPVEDAILNDDDRDWLLRSGLDLLPPARQLLLEDRFLAYVAFTRPSQQLVVTYAVADAEGKELRPSPYLEDLLAVCPDAGRRTVDDPFRERSAWGVRNAADLAAHLAYEFGNRPAPDRDASTARRLWNALYERARTDTLSRGPLRAALGALVYANRAALAPESVARLYAETLRTSVSRLETYAACPFKHFAEWNLKLEPRRSVRMQPVDVGKVHHAVLEDFVKRLLGDRRSLGDLDDAELLRRLEVSLRAVAEGLPETTEPARARDRYVIGRSRAPLERVLRAQQALCTLGAFRPAAAELRFGFEGEGGLPPLVVDTPAGRPVLLRGIVDRVDLAETAGGLLGLVLDYKHTAAKRLDLCNVYHGLALQLLAYLLMLRQHGRAWRGQPIVPAGALYVSLVEAYRHVDHPTDAEGEDSPAPVLVGLFRPRGVLDLAHTRVLDRTFAETGRSEVYQVALTQGGTLSHVDHSDAAESTDFTRLLVQTGRRIGEHADGILDGEVVVRPYRLGTFSPCSWCELHPVCRFEFPTARVRSLDRLTRSQVFERLKG